MTFEEFQSLCDENFDASRPADISKEFNVTPQVVNNWKTRDAVPYRYVKALRKKINKKIELDSKSQSALLDPKFLGYQNYRNVSNYELDLVAVIKNYFKKLYENYRLVILVTFIFSLFATLRVLYFVDPVFTSSATVLPSISKSSQSQISGLASQFGINLGSQSSKSDQIESVELYPVLIYSKTMTKKILNRKFYCERLGGSFRLIKIFNNDTTAVIDNPFQYKLGELKLLSSIKVVTSRFSPVVTISASAFEPRLASDIAIAIIEELESMQKKFKGKKANQKKEFIQNRLETVKVELTYVEEQLKIFREKNRKISSSPALALQLDRLVREVALKMEVYTTLKSQYEIAQIESVESNKTINIIDPPELPYERSSPRRKVHLMIGFMIGLLSSLFLVLIKDYKTIFKS